MADDDNSRRNKNLQCLTTPTLGHAIQHAATARRWSVSTWLEEAAKEKLARDGTTVSEGSNALE